MSEVKLTQKQADLIEKVKEGYVITIGKLSMLSAEEFAKAWIEGYEVEPQFKVGDVVVVEWIDTKKRELFLVSDNAIKHETIVVKNSRIHKAAFIETVEHATELEKQLFALGRTEPKLVEGDVFITLKGSNRTVCEVSNRDCKHLTSVNELNANRMLEDNKIDYIYPIEHRIQVGDNQ